MAKTIHVVPHKDGWATKREGNDRDSKVFEKKTDAVDSGRKSAKEDKTEFVIHKRDGKIQYSDSFGNDPNPPKDKNTNYKYGSYIILLGICPALILLR